MKLSPRQLYVANLGRRGAQIVLASGPVSSGKTEGAGRGWVQHVGRQYSGYDLMVVARSHAQMLGVVVGLLARVYGQMGVPFVRRARWYDAGDAHGSVNRIWPMVANDTSSVERVQGFTLAGVWCDEIAVMPWELTQELLMRLRVPGSKLVGTCNPEGPEHPIKTEWIDQPGKANAECHAFSLFDNPSLPAYYLDRLKTQFSGAVYLRKVLGIWAAASGAIWPGVVEAVGTAPPGKPDRLDVAVHWTKSGLVHAIFVGRYQGQAWIVDEWSHDNEDDPLTSDVLAQHLVVQAEALAATLGVRKVHTWITPPKQDSLVLALRRVQRDSYVVPAEPGLTEGIEAAEDWIGRRLRIDKSCRRTIGEASAWGWDERAADRKTDIPAVPDAAVPGTIRHYCLTRQVAELTASAPTRLLDTYSPDLPSSMTTMMTAEGLVF